MGDFMSKISNVLMMLQLLQSGRKYSISELSNELEVSERMIKVYKEYLEKAGVIMTAWNNDYWTYGAIDKYFDILFDYMNFKNSGRIYAKESGTVSMMPKKYYEDAYNLGREM